MVDQKENPFRPENQRLTPKEMYAMLEPELAEPSPVREPFDIDDMPCVERTLYLGAVGATAGTFFGAMQAAWYPDPIQNPEKRFRSANLVAREAELGKTDLRALVRTMMRPAIYFASATTAYSVGLCTAESVRGKKDMWNYSWAGLLSGAVIGSISKRFDITATAALGSALFMTCIEAAGNNMIYDQETHYNKMWGTKPKVYEESEEMKGLKEKYPKFNGL